LFLHGDLVSSQLVVPPRSSGVRRALTPTRRGGGQGPVRFLLDGGGAVWSAAVPRVLPVRVVFVSFLRN